MRLVALTWRGLPVTTGRSGHLLLVEDHRDIAEMVYDYFERRGYVVDHAGDGVTGLHLAVTGSYDAIILDLLLPGLDGMEICEKLRKDARSAIPILMLTARDTVQDKISGLDVGADDYLVKPFDIQELEARVRALIRRNRGSVSPERLQVGDLSLDLGTLQVERSGHRLDISPTGLKILKILMRASPRLVTRPEIEREVWGEALPDSDTLRSHVYNLRKIVDKPFSGQMICTMQSIGYRLIDPHEEPTPDRP
ncbi:response regulator transcription factor [Methylococcus mesophilus]|uniref:response regulator transcription factor n=1 Tax=Methylococcus mesophilus TaxID=2993564 RepID=UPI00224B177A|nr:response regulator transcription factor [Methylococcus mesophilus]UZR30436.1 response regulator transcription factor [Methylococcus mesophilus]